MCLVGFCSSGSYLTFDLKEHEETEGGLPAGGTVKTNLSCNSSRNVHCQIARELVS